MAGDPATAPDTADGVGHRPSRLNASVRENLAAATAVSTDAAVS